jgi:hypothetical protein
MSDATTCPACQRPTATAEQWATVPGGEGVGLCWGGRQCDDGARDALRVQLAEAPRATVPCEACDGRGMVLCGAEVEDGCDACDATGRVDAVAEVERLRGLDRLQRMQSTHHALRDIEEHAALRAQIAAAETEARTAIDEMHRRVDAAEAERDREHAARVRAEAEVDGRGRDLAAVAERARQATQTIVEAVGADGPLNVDVAAARIVSRFAMVSRGEGNAGAKVDALRAQLAEAERTLSHAIETREWTEAKAWEALGIAQPTDATALDLAARIRFAVEDRDAFRALLARAARGELPRCDDCGTRLATMRWSDTSDCMCDACLRELRHEHTSVGESLDEAACVDLPHTAALRAAMGGGA